MIDRTHGLPVTCQAQLLDLSRSFGDFESFSSAFPQVLWKPIAIGQVRAGPWDLKFKDVTLALLLVHCYPNNGT